MVRFALFGNMHPIMFARVEEEMTGVEEVVLSEKGAFGTAGTLDGGGDASMIRSQPSDNMRGFGPWAYLKRNSLCLGDHGE